MRLKVIFNIRGLDTELSFLTDYHSKVKEISLSNYLPVAGGRIVGSILFSLVLAQFERQISSSRIWTRVAVSISTMITVTLRPLPCFVRGVTRITDRFFSEGPMYNQFVTVYWYVTNKFGWGQTYPFFVDVNMFWMKSIRDRGQVQFVKSSFQDGKFDSPGFYKPIFEYFPYLTIF